jgi:hypothetical protein
MVRLRSLQSPSRPSPETLPPGLVASAGGAAAALVVISSNSSPSSTFLEAGAGQGLTLVHFLARHEHLLCDTPRGAGTEAWCLPIHAEASLSLSRVRYARVFQSSSDQKGSGR